METKTQEKNSNSVVACLPLNRVTQKNLTSVIASAAASLFKLFDEFLGCIQMRGRLSEAILYVVPGVQRGCRVCRDACSVVPTHRVIQMPSGFITDFPIQTFGRPRNGYQPSIKVIVSFVIRPYIPKPVLFLRAFYWRAFSFASHGSCTLFFEKQKVKLLVTAGKRSAASP